MDGLILKREGLNMDQVTLEAKVLTLEAAMVALIRFQNDKAKAFQEFNQGYMRTVKTSNEAGNAPLAQAIQKEAGMLSHYFK
jgi:hypothetical protein